MHVLLLKPNFIYSALVQLALSIMFSHSLFVFFFFLTIGSAFQPIKTCSDLCIPIYQFSSQLRVRSYTHLIKIYQKNLHIAILKLLCILHNLTLEWTLSLYFLMIQYMYISSLYLYCKLIFTIYHVFYLFCSTRHSLGIQ